MGGSPKSLTWKGVAGDSSYRPPNLALPPQRGNGLRRIRFYSLTPAIIYGKFVDLDATSRLRTLPVFASACFQRLQQ